MKMVDMGVGEQVCLICGGRKVSIVMQHKSGSRARLGIAADKEVVISNPHPVVEDGLVDTSF